MLHFRAPGRPGWSQRNDVHGTFDWKPVRFAVRVPDDATEAWLYLGLESTSGRAWFDDIRVTIGKPPVVRPTTQASGPVFKGHGLPRLRGAMVPQRIDEERIFVQVGAFGSRDNAERRLAALRSASILTAFVVEDTSVSPTLYRVRIGPIRGIVQYDIIVEELENLDIADPYLINE